MPNKIWSNTAQQWAVEDIATRYEERVELKGRVPPGYADDCLRVIASLGKVEDQIVTDPTTRQAVMDWWELNDTPPCFFAMQVLYRDAVLHLVVYMRSSSKEKWGRDLDFFRYVANYIERRLNEVRGIPVYSVQLHVFKASDHSYVGERE